MVARFWANQTLSAGIGGTALTTLSDTQLNFNNSGTSATTGTIQFDTRANSTTTANGDMYYNTATDTHDFLWHGTQAFNWSTLNDKSAQIKHALMDIFKKVPKSIKKQMTKEERKLIKAKYNSEKLLKQWLSADEYKSLRLKGEIEIPSQEDDTIFIIKKDPQAMIDVVKKGTYSHKLCVVAKDYEYPVGDQLLSKILLIKSDEKSFKKLAKRWN